MNKAVKIIISCVIFGLIAYQMFSSRDQASEQSQYLIKHSFQNQKINGIIKHQNLLNEAKQLGATHFCKQFIDHCIELDTCQKSLLVFDSCLKVSDEAHIIKAVEPCNKKILKEKEWEHFWENILVCYSDYFTQLSTQRLNYWLLTNIIMLLSLMFYF